MKRKQREQVELAATIANFRTLINQKDFDAAYELWLQLTPKQKRNAVKGQSLPKKSNNIGLMAKVICALPELFSAILEKIPPKIMKQYFTAISGFRRRNLFHNMVMYNNVRKKYRRTLAERQNLNENVKSLSNYIEKHQLQKEAKEAALTEENGGYNALELFFLKPLAVLQSDSILELFLKLDAASHEQLVNFLSTGITSTRLELTHEHMLSAYTINQYHPEVLTEFFQNGIFNFDYKKNEWQTIFFEQLGRLYLKYIDRRTLVNNAIVAIQQTVAQLSDCENFPAVEVLAEAIAAGGTLKSWMQIGLINVLGAAAWRIIARYPIVKQSADIEKLFIAIILKGFDPNFPINVGEFSLASIAELLFSGLVPVTNPQLRRLLPSFAWLQVKKGILNKNGISLLYYSIFHLIIKFFKELDRSQESNQRSNQANVKKCIEENLDLVLKVINLTPELMTLPGGGVEYPLQYLVPLSIYMDDDVKCIWNKFFTSITERIRADWNQHYSNLNAFFRAEIVPPRTWENGITNIILEYCLEPEKLLFFPSQYYGADQGLQNLFINDRDIVNETLSYIDPEFKKVWLGLRDNSSGTSDGLDTMHDNIKAVLPNHPQLNLLSRFVSSFILKTNVRTHYQRMLLATMGKWLSVQGNNLNYMKLNFFKNPYDIMSKPRSIDSSDLSRLLDSKLVDLRGAMLPINTLGEGDCPFHAVFGTFDQGRQQFICKDLETRRETVGDAIRSLAEAKQYSETQQQLYRFCVEGIKDLVMVNRSIGPALEKLKEAYYQFSKDNPSGPTSSSWKKFAEKLQANAKINEYIQTYGHPRGKQTLHAKFLDALNANNHQLYNLLNAELKAEFKEYNDAQTVAFNWEELITPELLKEYAGLLSKKGEYLLPHELAIIGNVFGVTVHVHPHEGAQIQTYNPEKMRSVHVRFKPGHFERMRTVEEWCALMNIPKTGAIALLLHDSSGHEVICFQDGLPTELSGITFPLLPKNITPVTSVQKKEDASTMVARTKKKIFMSALMEYSYLAPAEIKLLNDVYHGKQPGLNRNTVSKHQQKWYSLFSEIGSETGLRRSKRKAMASIASLAEPKTTVTASNPLTEKAETAKQFLLTELERRIKRGEVKPPSMPISAPAPAPVSTPAQPQTVVHSIRLFGPALLTQPAGQPGETMQSSLALTKSD